MRKGSSPRVRGEARLPHRDHDQKGIIPAGAGRSRRNARPSSVQRDHPRGCGEKATSQAVALPRPGSSPRVRGEAETFYPIVGVTGIIPAGAGRSDFWSRPRRGVGDHPRGCGEKRPVFLSAVTKRGSSPRVRGEAPHLRRHRDWRRIIPAGAGRSDRSS